MHASSSRRSSRSSEALRTCTSGRFRRAALATSYFWNSSTDMGSSSQEILLRKIEGLIDSRDERRPAKSTHFVMTGHLAIESLVGGRSAGSTPGAFLHRSSDRGSRRSASRLGLSASPGRGFARSDQIRTWPLGLIGLGVGFIGRATTGIGWQRQAARDQRATASRPVCPRTSSHDRNQLDRPRHAVTRGFLGKLAVERCSEPRSCRVSLIQ